MTLLLLALACGAKRAGPSPLQPEPIHVAWATESEAAPFGSLTFMNQTRGPIHLDLLELSPAGALIGFAPSRVQPGELQGWPLSSPDIPALSGTLSWHAPHGPPLQSPFRLSRPEPIPAAPLLPPPLSSTPPPSSPPQPATFPPAAEPSP